MNVREVIEALSHYPPDARVIVAGLERDFDDACVIEQSITANYNQTPKTVGNRMVVLTAIGYGAHATPDDVLDNIPASEVAVLIDRVKA